MLLFVFASFFTIILSSCGAQNDNVTRFNGEGESPNPEVSSTESGETEAKPNEAKTEEPVPETNADPVDAKEEPKAEAVEKSEPVTEVDEKKIAPENSASKSGKLSINSFKGDKLETKMSYNLIKGSTPKNTYSLTINGYKLKKYVPGQSTWNYIASTQLKTLKKGTNEYAVKALDKAGKEISTLSFSIEYSEVDAHALPNVGANIWLTFLMTFSVVGGYKLIRHKKWL